MTTIQPNISQMLDQSRFDLEGKDARTSSAERFQASESQSADLEIVTAEGDRVTLSYGAEESLGFSSYENLARKGGGFARSAGQSLSFERGQALSLSVTGDLSESELADIGSLLAEIDGVMGKMLDGDMEGALSSALEVGGFDSIAGFEADLHVERQVYAERSYMVETAGAAGAENAGPSRGHGVPAGGDLMDQLMTEMMASIENAQVEPQNLLKPVDGYFSALMEDFAGEAPAEEPKVRLTEMLHTQLMDRLRGMIEPAEGEIA